MGLLNEITNRTTILQRGSLLIASIDLWQSAVMLFVTASTIISTSCSGNGSYWHLHVYWFSDLYCRTPGVFVFALALLQIIHYALGAALSFGVRNKRAKMVKIWLYPNCFIIGIVGLIALVLIVTPLAVYALLLSMLFVFRAFQCWIVAEMLYNDLIVNASSDEQIIRTPDLQQL